MERLYATTHEWVILEGTTARMGISNHAQSTLGDIIFADFPKLGKAVTAGSEIIVLESMKAASPVHAPLSGTISEINSILVKKPEIINIDPLDKGWLVLLTGVNPTETEKLMNESTYFEYLKNQ